MPQLASWIRESDGPYFERFFALRPDLVVRDARVGPESLEGVDGVLITGGPDISAGFLVDQQVDESLIKEPDPVRDAWEFSAVQHAVGKGLPLLCICKGFQVLNVALGGSLQLDIRGHDLPEMREGNLQPLRYDAAARHRFPMVNSSHHQALDRVASGLQIEAWHAGDGVIEQGRLRGHPWAVGVQYHPERDFGYAPLFEDFFAQLGPPH